MSSRANRTRIDRKLGAQKIPNKKIIGGSMLHTLRRWIEFILVLLLLAGIVWLVKFKGPEIVKIPGTDKVMNMKDATQDIKNQLKQLEVLAQQQKETNAKVDQIIAQMNQNIKQAGEQKDIRQATEDMKSHWGGQ
jgi:hypothetical protein